MAAFPFQSSPHRNSTTTNTEEVEVTKSPEIQPNPHPRKPTSPVDDKKHNPVKYLPLDHVYSTTTACVSATGSSSNVMLKSNKVKAKKLENDGNRKLSSAELRVRPKPPMIHKYSRVYNRSPVDGFINLSVYDALAVQLSNNVPPSLSSIDVKNENLDDEDGDGPDGDKNFGVLTKKWSKKGMDTENLDDEDRDGDNDLGILTNKRKKKLKETENLDDDDRDGDSDLEVLTNKRNKKVRKTENLDDEDCDDDNDVVVLTNKRKRKVGCAEMINWEVDSSYMVNVDGPGLGENRTRIGKFSQNITARSRQQRSKCDADENGSRKKNVNSTSSSRAKRWVRLSIDGIDPKRFIGLECKVYWPLDADWYSGHIFGYDLKSERHQVKYEDGEEENVILSNERIEFYISPKEMKRLRLNINRHSSETGDLDVDEISVLTAYMGDCHEIESGDIIWAKLTGNAIWPAIVLDESLVIDRKGLSKFSGEKSVVVQFFGTHDFARVRTKQAISFLKGLLSSYCRTCKNSDFRRSLEEVKLYFTKQRLPKRMLRLQKSVKPDCGSTNEDGGHAHSGDEFSGDEIIQEKLEGTKSCLFEIGDLQVQSLGEIVKDSKCLKDKGYICPIGYKAVRKFLSITDSSQFSLYTMEVLRDADSRNQTLFRVTSVDGEQFDGATPSSCWNEVYKRIRNLHFGSSEGSNTDGVPGKGFESGSSMFGLSHPKVLNLLQETSSLKLASKISKLKAGIHEDMPEGYRPVHIKWKDLDKCNVCYMDEEYENDPFLQCDKCRMMVHARCYGELEPVDGILWLCNLCRPGALDVSPPCCICPVAGGAMKPTTDSRWAHLACAMWIPETGLSDIKRMEPIDGLSKINKDRWKLLCSICGVPYGACIQCSNNNCCVAYHPLCARAAGLCSELADEDRLHMIPSEEDEDSHCIHLVSFCKKHSPNPSIERPIADERIQRAPYSDFQPPVNPSGCARCEPYNCFGRRGRKEPEALAAASLKRSFVENRPYLIGGYCHHDPLSSSALVSSKLAGLENLKYSQLDTSRNIFSMAEKYVYMRKTFRKRLTFGKSAIHGFGIFTKQPHRAGDMIIEYTGELVRPSIADRREHLIYNSLVGTGTYMFRIDDKSVIDATRAGSIAHLINHSCEPNCHSRVISVNGAEHIIIFAKRDIKQWEELTYDYRFFSIDEQLACYCGFSKCRGVVNDVEAEEQVAKVHAPLSELIDWRGD